MSKTATPEPESLYASAPKIYPREVSGVYARLRVAAVWLLLGIFYGLPWLRFEGRQAVLFDLPARQFHIFGLTFWPQDFLFMALLLILAALTLFFVTALAGRLWCGYACPQTVWTEAFLWMERITEGPRARRMKLDKAPWNGEKLLRKGGKQFLWISFALFTGFTFVGYFTPITELATKLATFNTGPWETFWVLFYGFATYGNAGFLREQVCKYMCPYARFQSAMFDRDTLIISYDETRGEPRGGRKRDEDPKARGLGDCIDCTLCVQVCPTGIDIREGLQYECIACAACIDACDDVMDRMNYPRGLIRYSTQNAMDGKPSRVLRPRTLIYAVLLLVLFGIFTFAIANRSPVELDVIRDRNALYREVPGGFIENVYMLRLLNKQQQVQRFSLSASGLPELVIDYGADSLTLEPGEIRTVPARLRVPRGAAEEGRYDVVIVVTSLDDPSIGTRHRSRFFMPES
ncbi:MAG: cytochrome c oxidase accessory protein CcoG [Gammaproteobacteria bacterium]|nr:cytochrome c oxidase accessory protein CcoG [Gammaproteobacteria bacterium]